MFIILGVLLLVFSVGRLLMVATQDGPTTDYFFYGGLAGLGPLIVGLGIRARHRRMKKPNRH